MNESSPAKSWKAPDYYEDRNKYEVAYSDSLECCPDSNWHKQRCPKKSYWPCNKCGLFWNPDFEWKRNNVYEMEGRRCVGRPNGQQCKNLVTKAQEGERDKYISEKASSYLEWEKHKFCSSECARSFANWVMDCYFK